MIEEVYDVYDVLHMYTLPSGGRLQNPLEHTIIISDRLI